MAEGKVFMFEEKKILVWKCYCVYLLAGVLVFF